MAREVAASNTTRQKNIAFLADSFLSDESTGVNGTQIQLFNIANALIGRGFSVHYVASTLDWRNKESTHRGIKLHWMNRARGTHSWIREIRGAMRILDAINPDIVYQRGRSHLTCAAAMWAAKHRKRFVWASNGEDSCDFWKNLMQVRRSARPLWTKLLLWIYFLPLDLLIHRAVARADGVINQTAHQYHRLHDNFGKVGVVIPSYFPRPAQLTVNGKERLILWLANPGPGKRPDVFLNLAERLVDLAEWRFVLGGRIPASPYGKALTARIAKMPNVESIGAIRFADSNAWYARASLFVNTSLPEADGLPNSYIQAWYAGTPVLSLHHDPNGWITKHGLGFCANGGEADLAAQTRQLMNDPEARSEMAARCQAFAQETFGNEDVVDRYVKVFNANGKSNITFDAKKGTCGEAP